MGVEVASGCSNWLQSSNYWPPSSSRQTLASAISSPSTRRRGLTNVALVFRCVHRPTIFGTKLNRSLSFESKGRKSIKEVVTASLNAEFSGEEEFCREIQELALLFQLSDDDENNTRNTDDILESKNQNPEPFTSSKLQQPDWAGDMIPASIERKANSVELPFSLRIIQKKKQWQEGLREAGKSAYCSVKKAFSSMVFIIRELQSYTLQMREALFYEDLHKVLVRVQNEMNASFVWLFQQVFSQTPTLMVYVMILLANYSVFAMSSNVAFAATAPPITLESSSIIENQSQTKIDPSSIKTFSVNSSGKTTSIGGINGGGGNFRPVAGGTDGEESFDGAVAHHRKIIPDGVSSSLTISPSISNQTTHEEESSVWKSIVEEADNMQELVINGVLDRQTMQNFVSPVTAKVVEEEADGESLFRTALLYQMGLSEEPDNPLLLANYAQFMYIVAQDYDRFIDALELESSPSSTTSMSFKITGPFLSTNTSYGCYLVYRFEQHVANPVVVEIKQHMPRGPCDENNNWWYNQQKIVYLKTPLSPVIGPQGTEISPSSCSTTNNTYMIAYPKNRNALWWEVKLGEFITFHCNDIDKQRTHNIPPWICTCLPWLPRVSSEDYKCDEADNAATDFASLCLDCDPLISIYIDWGGLGDWDVNIPNMYVRGIEFRPL